MFIKVNDVKNGWFKFSNGKQNNLVYIIRFYQIESHIFKHVIFKYLIVKNRVKNNIEFLFTTKNIILKNQYLIICYFYQHIIKIDV